MSPLLILAAPSLAATLTVGSSGSYSTIQDAIDDAASGDTIQVGAGTYSEAVDFGSKELTLTTSASATISPPSGEDAVTIDGGQIASSVSGFEITPASARAFRPGGRLPPKTASMAPKSASISTQRSMEPSWFPQVPATL